ncbi:MAG TPA: twin-arginine translocase subunit TatC [Pirellulaceae bacterium]|nr:twin-arginine translocase subunit TatC [Pirellulaceae bacterium]
MVLKPSEDLFEDTRMSFGDHLEELRRVLVKSLIGLAIAFAIATVFADEVVRYLQTPLEDAIRTFMRSQAEAELAAANDGIVPPELQPLLEQDRLIPRKLKLEPSELLAALRESYPDLPAPAARSPHAFRASQLPLGDVPRIAQALGVSADGPSRRWLSAQLTDEERESLSEIASRTEATRDDQLRLLEILDRLAGSTELYRREEFADAYAGIDRTSWWPAWLARFSKIFAEETRENPLEHLRDELAKQDDPETRRRLNRILITRAMAPEIGLVRADLVDLQVWESTRINAQALKVEEVFMVWLKAALISALVLASPWIFYQIWTFVAAGLYPHEKRYIHLYLPMSLVLFLSGVLLAFFGVFQPVLMFLFQFNASMGIDPQPRIGEWLTFVMVLPLGFGIAFQLPLVMLFLNRIGLFTVQAYLEKWRVAILVIFVVAMILTPADPISMLLLAIPLSFLYFGGILLCRWLPRNRNPFAEAYEP